MTLGRTLRALALALLNATLLLILGIAVALWALAAEVRGIGQDAARAAAEALGPDARALRGRLDAALTRLGTLDDRMVAAAGDAASLSPLHAEVAATREEVAALRAAVERLSATAEAAPAAAATRLRAALAAAIAPEVPR